MSYQNAIKEVWEKHKLAIIGFSLIMITIIILGYVLIFEYYKDVSDNNYIIVNCKDQETGRTWDERYNNMFEFKESKGVCGESKIENPLFNNINYNITLH